jgi:class 3 adenylate cyclase
LATSVTFQPFRGGSELSDGPSRIATDDGIGPRHPGCSDGVRELGIEVRAGLYTGECEVMDGKVGGLALLIGARVAKEAQPGEVLVSSTVKDLVAGSGTQFEERGTAELKGVRGAWRLYSEPGR